MRALPILLLLAGSASAAPKAQKPAPPPPPAAPVQPQPTHAEGDYGGVEPGQGQKPEPGKKAKKPPPKGTLSWIGFETKNGGSELFFQSIAPFEVAQHVQNGTLVIELNGLTQLGHNTWRQLDTRFFDTPVAKIVAARTGGKKGAHLEVRVTFKNPKDAKEAGVRTATEADGFFYAYLSFGGGGGAVNMNEPEK